jgi:threonine synthase
VIPEAVAGIWRYSEDFDDDGRPARDAARRGLTLGEGETPLVALPDLARRWGLCKLLLKREDANPGGSHKDRGLLYQVVRHAVAGGGDGRSRTFVLSSSGNAAISAAAACRLTGDRLLVFVAPGTAPHKLARIGGPGALLVETSKPINLARYAARVFGLLDLRGTRDPIATVGYRSLGAEIAAAVPDISALVTFSSSGISLEGIADGLSRRGCRPALWAAQSGECLGIVRVLQPDVEADPGSPAGRLGIRNPPHAADLARRLVGSGGGARALRTAAIAEATGWLAGAGVHTSAEGAAVLAGIAGLAREGRLRDAVVVGVLTGRGEGGVGLDDAGCNGEVTEVDGPAPGFELGGTLRLEGYLPLRQALVGLGLEAVTPARDEGPGGAVPHE